MLVIYNKRITNKTLRRCDQEMLIKKWWKEGLPVEGIVEWTQLEVFTIIDLDIDWKTTGDDETTQDMVVNIF